jgi:hypothetical protein
MGNAWTSGVIYADTNERYTTGLWDKQELAEYALGQLIEDTEGDYWIETFVSKVLNNEASRVYTNLVDWRIDCWITLIKDIGLTPEALEKLQQLGLEDAVLKKLDIQCHKRNRSNEKF